jgi:hypothetical protein
VSATIFFTEGDAATYNNVASLKQTKIGWEEVHLLAGGRVLVCDGNLVAASVSLRYSN